MKFSNKKIISSMMSVLFVASLGISGCKSEAKADKTTESTASKSVLPVLTVNTIKPNIKEIEKSLNVTGTIMAWDQINVQSSVNGLKVSNIYGEAGDFISKGQTLVKLDDSLLNAQLASAKASLANAEAQLAKVKNPNREQDIAGQQAVLDQMQANYQNALSNYERYESMYTQGAVSKIDLDTRKTALDTAEASLRQQKERLDLMKEGSRSEDIRIAQASVSSVLAQIQQINVQLSQTIIKAPDSGMIYERQVKLGDVSSTMNKLFTIVRNNRFELQAKIPESDLKLVKVGSNVEIESDVNNDFKTKGKVRQIGPSVDSVTRQVIVKIDVDYVKGMLPGQFMKGKISLGKTKSLVIPSKAVFNNEGISKIFTVKNSVASSKTIETGTKIGDFVEIKSGLQPNDEIVLNGVGFLKDGDPIKVVPEQVRG